MGEAAKGEQNRATQGGEKDGGLHGSGTVVRREVGHFGIGDLSRGGGVGLQQGNNVGIWHETYLVPAGSSETIYANMPLLGLGRVSGGVPANSRGRTAAERLHRK